MKKLYFFLLVLLSLAACENAVDDTVIPDPPMESTGTEEDFHKMIINYGLTTFQSVLADGEENVLISPFSLETALYMTMNGCAGETLEEFRIALKAEQFYPSGLNPHYKNLVDKLTPKAESTILGLANTIFYDEKKVFFQEQFQDVIADIFKGDFNQADFDDDSTVDLINNWAKESTENRIDKILENIQSDEAIFLINALFFKAQWKKGFPLYNTQEKSFTKENGEEVLVDMMSSDDYRDFYQGEDFTAVDLKLTDDEYSMTLILPGNAMSVSDFVESFGDKDFYELYIDLYTNKLVENRIHTTVPKFEIEAHKNMKDILEEMGLETAFQNADLSKMGTFTGKTSLSRVLHDTFLKIDEKGVEGAAITTVGVAVTSAPPNIDFNKPFVFIIRHVETNTPIFIGKLGDPS